MGKLDLEKWSDEELLDNLTGSRITYTGFLSDKEYEASVLSRPSIHPNDRGRYIRFTSAVGVRFVQLEKISNYRKRKK